jgi:hypothetical protein
MRLRFYESYYKRTDGASFYSFLERKITLASDITG